MDKIMALGANLIALETRRVETAGHNVANAATSGFKREVAFDDLMDSVAPTRLGTPALKVGTDFSAGKLVHTGDPFDLSINGNGFFEVASPNGPAYTRLGALTRDDSGRLLARNGWPLQGSAGDVVVTSADWHVEPDGTVIDAGNPVATVKVVAFDDPSKLRRLDGGFFVADAANPVNVDDPQIRQGFVETSNVTLANDMIQMMAAMRRVESGQKIVHAYDDMIGTVLQRLGDM
ncbi:hypothetical protein BG58_41075 [Caballeronia jiangsuensis]|nr:hypothetical protein BG58_41075 [Caballeronia jiangsuensis]